jgi:predicted short-subunit dehydrogenase-like oxidoreductase (DUF2520 family)
LSRHLAIVGEGRAGASFARALGDAGWQVSLHHHDELDAPDAPGAGTSVLLCVPDSAVGGVAAGIEPSADRVVLHCSGSLGLDVLDPAPARASVHPLASLPDAGTGARRLSGCWFAVAGDPFAAAIAAALGGTAVEVGDADRASYHAAAAIASNHLVALLGQVARVAAEAGVPLEAYRRLATETLEGAFDLGPAAALTGPVSRGDWDTVRRHLDAIPAVERPAYLAMLGEAARLAGREVPEFSE